MPRYIDVEKLYERFAELEAQAMAQIEKLNKIPFEERTKEDYDEWRIWSAILAERTAFKRNVADATTADVVEVVRCKDCWKRGEEDFCPLVSDNCYPPALPDDWFCKDGERREDGKLH